MRKKKNNRSYKFTEKKKSVRGMIACVGAVISLLILAGMLIQAVTSAGNGGAFLGSAGVVALFVGVASFIEAVQAVQEKTPSAPFHIRQSDCRRLRQCCG